MSARNSRRLVPDEPLPPYSYVTGKFPHPTRDPAGHSFGRQEEHAPPPEGQDWTRWRHYLVGCDFFNHGYYWEAHETWEAAWNGCGRHGVTADFLKALIKLAAAGVKAREDRPAGVARHGRRAAELFRNVQASARAERYLGLDVEELILFAEKLERGLPLEAPSDDAVEIVFDFGLYPQS